MPGETPILVATPHGERAWRNLCPHSGGPLARPGETPLSRDGTHLVCATHGALFRVTDGLCVAGPCQGASLTPWPS
jgi:nitrite reductase/ring-hydroxylating ferredoxin subunit